VAFPVKSAKKLKKYEEAEKYAKKLKKCEEAENSEF